ncbi:hypothetical protein [Secundilactobacillus odoratitofui]|uniref:hypothetical protein n=1 Tax=Secundilactobacillus odoratitofui TaxID=480930 RepID=UPI0006D09BD3|nr:hypothetical protein [Secundilactobacillus odoratitofui]
MTHFRKSLGLLGVSLGLIGGAIVVGSTETANAATWHKGIPSTFKTHKYWVTKSKVKTEYGKNYYGRKYITFSYRNKIWSITRFDAMYYKDGKGYINNNFINYDSGEGTPYLAYAKTKKNTYELKRTKQMSGWLSDITDSKNPVVRIKFGLDLTGIILIPMSLRIELKRSGLKLATFQS